MAVGLRRGKTKYVYEQKKTNFFLIFFKLLRLLHVCSSGTAAAAPLLGPSLCARTGAGAARSHVSSRAAQMSARHGIAPKLEHCPIFNRASKIPGLSLLARDVLENEDS